VTSALSEPPDLESKLKSFEDSSSQLKSKADNLLKPLAQIGSTDIEKKLREIDADLTRILEEIDKILENTYLKLGKEIDEKSAALSSGGLPLQRQQKLQLDFNRFRDRRTESFQVLHSGKKRLEEGKSKIKTIRSIHAAVLEIGGPEDANEVLRKVIGDAPPPHPVSRQTLPTNREQATDVKNKDTYRLFIANGSAPIRLMKGPSETSGTLVQLPNTISGIVLSGSPQGPDSAWYPVRVGNLSGFLKRDNLCLNGSPLGVRICPGPNRESWQKAVTQYPNLAVPGSDTQRKFAEQARLIRASRPNFFASGDWPLELATTLANPPKTPTQTMDWMSDSTVKSSDESLRRLFETLTRQSKTEHLTANGLSVNQLERDQSEWSRQRQVYVSSQPLGAQRETAISLTRERIDSMNHLLTLVTRTRDAAESQERKIDASTVTMTVADFVKAGANISLEKRTILSGTFIVTATSATQAVLRPLARPDSKVLVPSARVIVEYPRVTQVPIVGSKLSANESLEVQRALLGKDSELNILVRHVQTR
jgi:hypothetical protein